jgi:ATP-dependent RNA helicase DeaD
MPKSELQVASFRDLGLSKPLLAALDDVGYETPSPIQARTIPPLLKGLDVLGHAPTGTGKTAAFALPLLAGIEPDRAGVQVLVLTPTRELAIQVSEAFQRYAAHLPGFRVLPVYGGQDYKGQIRQLTRGVHAVVGTPGRIMDHMRRGTLVLETLKAVVLDEADEMLRMGFIEDVEWILGQTPGERQVALFSATMPREVQSIARRHLRSPEVITIESRTATAESVRQRYWPVSGLHKLDALTRILEVEDFDAMIIFVRTRTATVELAERLQARGLAAAALSGDMAQKQREQTIERLRRGSLDILVATDVAARGLDVDRISHVVNYDIPYDTEAYIHRIGRTGRAGRTGDAILFVAPREQRMLAAIERATRQKIQPLKMPTSAMVNDRRIAAFQQSIRDTLAAGGLESMQEIVGQVQRELGVPAIEIAAALARMAVGERPLLLDTAERAPVAPLSSDTAGDEPDRPPVPRPPRRSRRDDVEAGATESRRPAGAGPARRRTADARDAAPAMDRYRVEVGLDHGVRPANLVGAIANEAGLEAGHIGRIDIQSDHSFVELPAGMPREVFLHLQKTWVCKRRLAISRADDPTPPGDAARPERKRTSRAVGTGPRATGSGSKAPAGAAKSPGSGSRPVRSGPKAGLGSHQATRRKPDKGTRPAPSPAGRTKPGPKRNKRPA